MGSQCFQNQAVLLYQSFFTAGVLSFTLATVSSLPIFEQGQAYAAFAKFIRIAACLTAVSEVLELFAAPVPLWRARLCAMSLLGQAAYLWSADDKSQFNIGESYLLAILITSIAAELKILAIVLENRNFKKIMLKEKRRIFQYGLYAAGSVVVLIGTLILSLSDDKARAAEKAGIFNCSGGLISSLSIIFVFRKEKYSGYRQFSQGTEIPRIEEI